MRSATSARIWAGSENSSAAACDELRCERMNAMVWGCSLWMNFASCWGSAFCSASKAAVSLPRVFTSRSTSLRAVSGPKALISNLRA